ncbi:metallophosphoesterase [Odoribacter lunatus]|uniref:metallophosphoesterase n=1 Tax=Odoribacter lunatus TaxID=2941335 RepID=UPI00203F3158|nr:metallophosphoesterase [Odoribacter lunatus]
MRSNSVILLLGILFILVTDSILYFQLKRFLRTCLSRFIFGIHSLLFIIGFILYYVYIPHLKGPESYYWVGLWIGIFILFYIPKIIFILFNILAWPINRLSHSSGKKTRYTATIIAGIFFLSILYSITYNRYNYKIQTISIEFPQLPASFKNFKIIQLSDLHLGSHSVYYSGIPLLVDKVNSLHPDVILFTGDMVNNFAVEICPWIEELSRLKARYGKYAVTGNHDYGLYTQWPDSTARLDNMRDFYNNMKDAGFTMLNNSNIPIIKGNDTLYIAGVENWGNPPFPRFGKLSQALENTEDHFVILLSHDPSHWRAEILNHPIPLTLSGHTHAMQMGIKIGKFKWSPARLLYPEYDGLYYHDNHYINVSRGEGYIGFPGRIGLRPQIDEIILN